VRPELVAPFVAEPLEGVVFGGMDTRSVSLAEPLAVTLVFWVILASFAVGDVHAHAHDVVHVEGLELFLDLVFFERQADLVARVDVAHVPAEVVRLGPVGDELHVHLCPVIGAVGPDTEHCFRAPLIARVAVVVEGHGGPAGDQDTHDHPHGFTSLLWLNTVAQQKGLSTLRA
jgi:hypothetical protein